MTEFKVGDRIRVVNTNNTFAKNLVGEMGTIVEVDYSISWYRIYFDSGINQNLPFRYSDSVKHVGSKANVPPPAWNGRVTVDGKEYKVEWMHDIFDNTLDREVLQMPVKAQSICKIIKEGAEYGMGFANCSWKDNFSRKTGRKLSLQRALDNSNFTHAQRQQVWEQVLAVKGLVR